MLACAETRGKNDKRLLQNRNAAQISCQVQYCEKVGLPAMRSPTPGLEGHSLPLRIAPLRRCHAPLQIQPCKTYTMQSPGISR